MCLGLLWLIILESSGTMDNLLLCRTDIFLLVRIGGEIMTFLFFIIGLIITSKVKKLIRENLIDKSMVANYKKSLVKLW